MISYCSVVVVLVFAEGGAPAAEPGAAGEHGGGVGQLGLVGSSSSPSNGVVLFCLWLFLSLYI